MQSDETKTVDEVREEIYREQGKGTEGAPRAWTKEEVQRRLVERFIDAADYWASVPKDTEQEKCRGLAFSILALLDGSNIGIPAFHLTPAPHPDDKQYALTNEFNYYVDEVINDDVCLHDLFYPLCREIDANIESSGRRSGSRIGALCGRGIADRIHNSEMWEILRERMSTIQASGEEYDKKREAILGKVALNYLLCSSALEWDYLTLLREKLDFHRPDLATEFVSGITTAIRAKLYKNISGVGTPSATEERRLANILEIFTVKLKAHLKDYLSNDGGDNFGGTVMDLVEYLMQDTDEWVYLLNYDYLIFKDTEGE